ncbi:hypothetical protein LOC69_10285 [Blastopirellula sp. JC733]|nr:hypothetical protein [Blastopirellula sediminis]
MSFPIDTQALDAPAEQTPYPVIYISGDFFAETLNGGYPGQQRVSWIEGELVEVRPVNAEKLSVYHLQLRIDRHLFGEYLEPQRMKLNDVVIPSGAFRVFDSTREPKTGDRVFLKLTKSESGDWRYKTAGVPSDMERKRIDRVCNLLSRIDVRGAAQEMLVGCRDVDPVFAVWCMNAISPIDVNQTPAEEWFYGRLRAQASPVTYRSILLEVLTDDASPAIRFVSASRALFPAKKMPEADQAIFHYAHCRRLRNYFDRELAPFERKFFFHELEHIRATYGKMPESDRRELLLILREFADHQSPERQQAAFDLASGLHSEHDDALNADILRLFSEHCPHPATHPDAEATYWFSLDRYMTEELKCRKRSCDVALDLFEKRLPTADPPKLRWFLQILSSYAKRCQREQADWDHLAERLRTLAAVEVTPEQRKMIEEFLRSLKIEPTGGAKT